jgi:hypothetical protein
LSSSLISPALEQLQEMPAAERTILAGQCLDLAGYVAQVPDPRDPLLAVDAALRDAWHGFSKSKYDQVVRLGWQDTSIPVGGVVRDDSWIEVFAGNNG